MTLEITIGLAKRLTETTGIQHIVYLCNCKDGTYEITTLDHINTIREDGKVIIYPDKYKTK